MGEQSLSRACTVALMVSRMPMDIPDLFVPGRTCGKGKWPSIQFARFLQTGNMLYGPGFPLSIGFPSLYSSALFYADLTQNGGKYAGKLRSHPDEGAIFILPSCKGMPTSKELVDNFYKSFDSKILLFLSHLKKVEFRDEINHVYWEIEKRFGNCTRLIIRR